MSLSAISRRALLHATILASTALLPAIGHAEEPRRGGTLTAIVQPEPVILTAALNTAAPTGVVTGSIFEGLVDYDAELKPIPRLAESWEVAQDGLALTLHLRQGVRWHDGAPFTSADVKWTVENVWQKIHPRNKAIFATVTAVDTPDDHTAILRLSKPSLAILSSLNSNGAQLLPKHLYDGTDILANPHNNAPVGTGPFRFKEWKKGEYIVLERNPDYWDQGLPYLDRVIFKVIPDAATRAAAFEKGEVQYAPLSPVPLKDAARLDALPGLRVTTAGYEWLSPFLFADFNIRRPGLDNLKVRQALAHAIDKNAIAKVVWYGFGKPATSPVPSSLQAFHDASLPAYPHDVAKANALLDAAGLVADADGVRLKLFIDYIPYGDDYKRTAEYLKQAFKRVGVEATVRTQDTAAYTRRVYGDRDFDVAITWFAAFSDPQIGVLRAYNPAALGQNIPWTNGSGYDDPRVNELIRTVAVEADPAKRIADFKQFQKIVLDDVPTVPLIELKFFTVEAENLRHPPFRGDQVYGSFRDFWLADTTGSN